MQELKRGTHFDWVARTALTVNQQYTQSAAPVDIHDSKLDNAIRKYTLIELLQDRFERPNV